MDHFNIVFAPDNNYAKHCGVTIASILRNSNKNTEFNFYILDGTLTEENKEKLSAIDAGKPYNIAFIKIDEKDFADFPTLKYISVSTWYRLKTATLLPDNVDRVLYLDCDIVVATPLDELFDMPLDGYLLAASIDNMWKKYTKSLKMDESYRYFNAGVLMMSLKEWRKQKIEEKILNFLTESPDRLQLMDQTVLNICLGDKYKELDVRWNFQYSPVFLGDTCYYMKESRNGYISAFYNPAIFHFMGPLKPWDPELGGLYRFRDIYYKYLKYTPWKFESEEKEILFHKNATRRIYFKTFKFVLNRLAHQPLLFFRKYFLGRILLALQTTRPKNK